MLKNFYNVKKKYTMTYKHENIIRVDQNHILIKTPNLDITLFANEDVPFDKAGFEEICNFAKLSETLKELNAHGFFGENFARIDKCILTPDFHKGYGIPIGTVFKAENFVVPAAIGNDVGCGMRLLTTDIMYEEFRKHGKELDDKLRHIFFQGGRNIPLSSAQRIAIFKDGLQGLVSTKYLNEGIWEYWDQDQQEDDIMRVFKLGKINTYDGVFDFSDYIKGSGEEYTYDDQIGSLGGGNHFAEMQVIDEIFDGSLAYQWGLRKGYMTIMIHTGSIGIGHFVGEHFKDIAKNLYPKNLKNPEHGFYVLPDGDIARQYLTAMGNAANFAFANRLFLGLMAIKALSEIFGRRIRTKLVYDAPHNLVFDGLLHRKGACPAELDTSDPEFPNGSPVLIPGSMGTYSYVLKGNGNIDSLCSACHGAGRISARQTSRHSDVSEIDTLRVITKLDFKDPTLRQDIIKEYQKTLLEEAPKSYKNITPIINTVVDSGIASTVCKLWPLLTLKG